MNGALNGAWVVLFSFGLFGPALAVMMLLLASLARIHTLVGPRSELDKLERFVVALPFEVYLAWISVALIANSFQFATASGWDGLGRSAEIWAMAMMLLATTVGALMTRFRGVWAYPLVVAWALAGIAVRYAEAVALSAVGWGLVLVGLAGLVSQLLWLRPAHAWPAHRS